MVRRRHSRISSVGACCTRRKSARHDRTGRRCARARTRSRAILAGTSAGASVYGDEQREAPAGSSVEEDSYADTATTTMPSETATSDSAAVPAANDEGAAGSQSDVTETPDAATGGSPRAPRWPGRMLCLRYRKHDDPLVNGYLQLRDAVHGNGALHQELADNSRVFSACP